MRKRMNLTVSQLADIIMSLVGEIEPVGETMEDAYRYENLLLILDTIDTIMEEIWCCCDYYDEPEWSMRKSALAAIGWMKERREWLNEILGTGWIPCSERLPEEHEWIGTKEFGTTISDTVNITFDVNGKRFVKVMSLQNGELSDSDKKAMDIFHKGWKMLAWMPLLESYKEGVDDVRMV